MPARAEHILAIPDRLGLDHAMERSYKVSQGQVQSRRFLVGVHKSQLGPDPGQFVSEVARELGMPPALEQNLRDRQASANMVHLGFEEGPNGALYKAYLEFGSRLKEVPPPEDPMLLFLGFKWNPDRADQFHITRYELWPFLSQSAIHERIDRHCGYDAMGVSGPFARGVVDTAFERCGPDEVLYLEVTEEGNSRASFDINVYRAGLNLEDMHQSIISLGRGYGIEGADRGIPMDFVLTGRLGHISAGIGRDGRSFVSIYHGAHRRLPGSEYAGL